MRSDGFDAVGLVVPWGDFEPGISPPTFNPEAFSELDRLVTLAQDNDLKVVLRLSYGCDVFPGDQMAWGVRFLDVFGQQAPYVAWLDYISAVRKAVAHDPDVVLAELSWEDFWSPIWMAKGMVALAPRLSLATTIGFTTWLEARYSLPQVSWMYGEAFTSWAQVPTPLMHQSAFSLLYRFVDDELVHRFFLPARKRFPGLVLEARVDGDPIYQGTRIISTYSHAATWAVPGTTLTGMYFSPSMGISHAHHHETAAQGLQSLATMLHLLHNGSGGRALFVFEFEFLNNAHVVKGNPVLGPAQINPFLRQSARLLRRYTVGYALWTYRDFNQSPVWNPDFAEGANGWEPSGPRSASTTTSPTYLAMGPGSSIAQRIPPPRLQAVGSDQVTVSVRAKAPAPARLVVDLGRSSGRTIEVEPGWHTYQLAYLPSQLGSGRLAFTAQGDLDLTSVEIYDFTQKSDVYSTGGQPRLALKGVRQLNRELSTP